MQTISGKTVTDRQAEVYDALERTGPAPDHVLVPIVQHMGNLHQSSSGVRTRRRELQRKGLVTLSDTVKMPSGRSAAIWEAT